MVDVNEAVLTFGRRYAIGEGGVADNFITRYLVSGMRACAAALACLLIDAASLRRLQAATPARPQAPTMLLPSSARRPAGRCWAGRGSAASGAKT